jgi:hypothetical protein
MKFVLTLIMCSYLSGECLPPHQWHEKFDSGYDCSIAGYEESAKKLKQIGKADVELHRISIRFTCTGDPEI